MATPQPQVSISSDEKPAPPPTGNKKPFQRPKNKIANKPPPPRNKSIKETPLTNDPLWKDSFIIDGETGFVNEASAKEFNADAAGYVNLVEQEYKAISDVDKYYAKSIPASAHAYYHLVIYWYKLALIAQKRGLASNEQDRLVRFVQGYSSNEIAAGAGEYLDGLGDYEDNTGVKHLLRFEEPNALGHFGRVTAQTHGFYETLPAPAIFYHRVVEDLVSSQRGAQPDDGWVDDAIVPHGPPQDPEAPARPAGQAARIAARALAEAGPAPEGEGKVLWRDCSPNARSFLLLPTLR